MRILLVEDDPQLAKSIKMICESEGYQVESVDLGEDGLDMAKVYEFDIILLDLGLPDMEGFDVLKKIRAGKNDTPVLILSGQTEVDNRVKGLGYGADDFLNKPFDKKELLARIKAIVRRSKGHAQSEIITGKVKVNLDKRMVEAAGQPVHLTSKEYAILELLSLRKGTPLTKEQFLTHLYGGMDEPEVKIIDVFVCKLRKKLEEATGGDNYIETVWGRGYVLRDPSSQEAQSEARVKEAISGAKKKSA